MEQEIVTQEVVLEKVRQRLGSLDNKAEQAVAEAIAILNESRQTLPQQEDEFVSANVNVSVAQYVAWSPEERFQYLNNAEKVNARWVERQFQKLNAAWLMVIDGQVVAHDADIDNLLRAQEFNALCQKYNGKYPFVFFHPKLFMIEETTAWHATQEPDDAYPTVVVKLRGERSEATLVADFDTGATHAYIACCIKEWRASPFVAINPNRTALVGRGLFHKLAPIVHLDFAARQTEIEFHNSTS